MVALDASALIALILREPGANLVAERLPRACISSVNTTEVLSRLLRDRIDLAESLKAIAMLGVEQVAFEPGDAPAVAGLITATRSFGLSLGDCACLNLARMRGVPALTADRSWAKLDIGVEVELIR